MGTGPGIQTARINNTDSNYGTQSRPQCAQVGTKTVLTNNKDNIYIKDSEELSNKDLNIHSVLQFLSEYKVERKNTVVNLSTRDFTPAEVSVQRLELLPHPGGTGPRRKI